MDTPSGSSLSALSWQHPGVEWSTDVTQADWIVERLHPFAQDVGSAIPEGFEAYARVFHPARRGDRPVRWAEVAAWSGRIVHPEMQWHRIADGPWPPPFDTEPWTGSSAIEPAAALVDVLSPSDTCWFGVWEGFGGFEYPAVPKVEVPCRAYFLYQGSINDALAFVDYPYRRTPQLWWSSDRSWCISSEIDFAWTYVGGAAWLVDRILADPRLEALPAEITDRFTYDSDRLNT